MLLVTGFPICLLLDLASIAHPNAAQLTYWLLRTQRCMGQQRHVKNDHCHTSALRR